MKAIVNASIKDAQNLKRAMDKRIAWTRANRVKLNNIMRVFSKEEMANNDSHIYLYDKTIMVDLRQLDGFKDARLVQVLDRLTAMTDEVSTCDYPAQVNRDYSFHMGERYTDNYIGVRVSAYVREDSPTCKKVVIGTEMVEQLTYEIVCD